MNAWTENARRLIENGTRYVYQGRDPRTGLDCMGVLLHLYREVLGVDLPDHAAVLQDRFDRQEVFYEGLEAYADLFDEIPRSETRAGDVVVFYDPVHQSNHVAVAVSERHAIHAGERIGVVRSRLVRLFRLRCVKVYRYVGDDEAET